MLLQLYNLHVEQTLGGRGGMGSKVGLCLFDYLVY